MGFIYQDITSKDVNSGQYSVSVSNTGITVGQVIQKDGIWYALKPGSNTYVNKTFQTKEEAAKYLKDQI
jgi:hypothetical protein